jgi:hypothetical protein
MQKFTRDVESRIGKARSQKKIAVAPSGSGGVSILGGQAPRKLPGMSSKRIFGLRAFAALFAKKNEE